MVTPLFQVDKMMSTYQVAPLETFKFKTPEDWLKRIQRFEQFRCTSGLNKKSQEIQVNTLVYSMGDEADDILSSFHLSSEDKVKYDIVKEKFDAEMLSSKEPKVTRTW